MRFFISLFVTILLITLSFGCDNSGLSTHDDEPGYTTVTYTETHDLFPNPERGWYKYRKTDDMWGLDSLRPQNITLIYMKAELNDYKDRSLDAAKLNEIRTAFSLARQNGIKVVFRAAYTDSVTDDPPLTIMTGHLDQLKPIFEANQDVIHVVEAGFLGPWGEWHSSNHGSYIDVSAQKTLLFKLLESVPSPHIIMVRRPSYIRDIFEDEIEGITLEASDVYTSNRLARTGYHNDGFLTSASDLGTYNDAGWDREAELAWAGNQCSYTTFGGETGGTSDFTWADADNAVRELEMLHASYLNNGWYGETINLWKTSTYHGENAYNHIERRLGYRFVLNHMSMTEDALPGGRLHILLNLKNVGFSAPFHKRPVYLVVQKDDETYHTALNVDPRTWSPSTEIALDLLITLPKNLSEGNWRVFLHLPDQSETLTHDPTYSIRLANEAVWQETTGYNLLTDNLTITSHASGEDYGYTVFEQLEE